MNQLDIQFLERLAERISDALYYGKHGPIGTNGSVSPGLMHDDYDRLRKIVKDEKIKKLEEELATLKAKR